MSQIQVWILSADVCEENDDEDTHELSVLRMPEGLERNVL